MKNEHVKLPQKTLATEAFELFFMLSPEEQEEIILILRCLALPE